jgi:DNA-binding response OmpR family regulator
MRIKRALSLLLAVLMMASLLAVGTSAADQLTVITKSNGRRTLAVGDTFTYSFAVKLQKPYDIDILLAKIKGIFTRRYQTDILSDGFLKIDKSKRIAYKENTPLDLRQKEFDLLLLLAENAGKTLSKDYLFNQIWGFDSFSEPQTLTVHIKWLRQKIEANPKKPEHIVTVWGVGYRYER